MTRHRTVKKSTVKKTVIHKAKKVKAKKPAKTHIHHVHRAAHGHIYLF